MKKNKTNHYLLWATGKDQPGIVAAVTKLLFENKCNLEDSSMTRLGGEFGILLIFSSKNSFSRREMTAIIDTLEKKKKLNVGLKPITTSLAMLQQVRKIPLMVTVHGVDKPGIVFHVTDYLSKKKFNISDLETHRTAHPKRPGYILFIEGEVQTKSILSQINRGLGSLQNKLGSKIDVKPIPVTSL